MTTPGDSLYVQSNFSAYGVSEPYLQLYSFHGLRVGPFMDLNSRIGVYERWPKNIQTMRVFFLHCFKIRFSTAITTSNALRKGVLDESRPFIDSKAGFTSSD